MFALAVDLLAGRYVATAHNDRARAEWPPHPARLFSALVSALPDDVEGLDSELDLRAMEAGLRWLEAQPAPAMSCAAASRRAVVPTYVPVNDVHVVQLADEDAAKVVEAEAAVAAAPAGKARQKAEAARAKATAAYADTVAKALAAPVKPSNADLVMVRKRFAEQGLRQPRTFPSVTPGAPTVVFCWPAAPDPALADALDRLAARVHRLGHSSSLVSVRVLDAAPEPTLVPRPDGELLLRTPGPGQLDRLRAAWAVHRETEPRVLPCAVTPYGSPADPPLAELPQGELGDDWIVLRRVAGPRLPLSAAPALAERLRAALMARCPDPVPAVISGHAADGSPLHGAHLAFVPLPFVADAHADGALLGAALVLPRQLSDDDRERVYAAVGEWEAQVQDGDGPPRLRLLLGRAGELDLQRETGGPALKALQPATWSRPARRWASVTPIALDRNPGDLRDPDPARADAAVARAAEIVRAAVVRAGLPAPAEVLLSPAPQVQGGLPVRAFPPYPRTRGRTRRVQVHATLVFDTPVRGPLLIGAGRFFGLGLLRPLPERT
jgi:CRISPR-associated protein Csb2